MIRMVTPGLTMARHRPEWYRSLYPNVRELKGIGAARSASCMAGSRKAPDVPRQLIRAATILQHNARQCRLTGLAHVLELMVKK